MSWFRRETHPTEADLSAFIDGELAPARAAALQSHIDGCEACSAQVEALQSVKSMLSSMPRPALPRSFTLTAAPAAATQPRRTTRSPLAFAPAVTLTLLVALLFVDLAVQPATTGTSHDESGSTATLAFDASSESAKASANAAEGPVPMSAPAQAPAPRAAGSAGAAADAAPPQSGAPSTTAQPGFAPQVAPAPGPPPGSAGGSTERSAASVPAVPPAPPASVTADSYADSSVLEPDDAASRPPVTAASDDSGSGFDLLTVLELIAGGAFVLSLLLAWMRRRAA